MLMFTIIKDSRIDAVIISKARFAISVYFFIVVSIKLIDLLLDRDLIFESEQLNVLTLLVNIVDYNLSRIVIRNNIDLLVTLNRYARLDKILEYEVERYF